MKEYNLIEHNIISAFKEKNFIFLNNSFFNVETVGKPRPSNNKGECKTDVYVLLSNVDNPSFKKELKISVKMTNKNHWQESKISPERAEEIFGEDYEKILTNRISEIKDRFLSSKLFFKDSFGNTKEHSITMGWRLEITNTPRKLSCPINLNEKEIIDSFYKGSNLPIEKRNSLVNGLEIKNSGIANYILFIDLNNSNNIDYIISNLTNLDNFLSEPLHLTFIANNYRISENKIDGNRPLAVSVCYQIKDDFLEPIFIFNKPLHFKGKILSKIFNKKFGNSFEKIPFRKEYLYKKA